MHPDFVTVSVPATSANLGPGFDSFGLALELRNRFTAHRAEVWSVRVTGEGAGELPENEENPVVRAMKVVFAEAGFPGQAAALECHNEIPTGEGLGSSASAIVGGMVLADRLCGAGLGVDRLLRLAAEMEGHPDNVAAALLGGFTVAWTGEDGVVHGKRIEPALGVAAVVVTTQSPLATEVARSMLPDQVPHGDASFNASRAGLLVAGFALGDTEALAAGLADRIHEQYRRAAIPDLEDVRTILLAAGATGAVVSGAGPAIIGVVTGEDDRAATEAAARVAQRSAASIEALPGRCSPRAVVVSRSGALIE